MTQDNPSYHDTARFDADFKKRQKEIKDELVEWSRSKEFSECCEKVIKSVLQNHSEIKSLSNCLLEHEPFISAIKDLAQNEAKIILKELWWQRLSKWFWLVIGSLVAMLFGFLGSWLNGLIF